ncbi:MAG: VanZ family protein [Bacilli bacterium]|nr:VanZ family protein [Bacilli bacterium]
MKFRKSSHNLKYRIVRAVFLFGYLTCLVVLGVEAGTPGKQSAAKSDIVGATIENILNDINGDSAKEILPTGCYITNEQTEFKVGEKTQLNILTLPDDATYQSYSFKTSDSEVASVNEVGSVKFLKAGSVTITATNTKVNTVKDTITFTATNIDVTSFTSSIDATIKDGVYQLEVGASYVVKNTFTPNNATIQTVAYEYNLANDYIEMEDDTINVVKESEGTSFDLVVKCGELSNTLKIKTYNPSAEEDDHPLVSLKASNVTKYINQTSAFTPSIKYNPTSTSEKYRGYTLSSSDTSVIKVSGTKLVPQGVIGQATITATSTYDTTIFTSFTVYIKDRATLTQAKILKYSETMYVGNTQKLVIQNTPSSNLSLKKTYTSSNPDVASINTSGSIVAIAPGTTTITYQAHDKVHNIDKSDSVTITVTEPPEGVVSDIEVGPLQGENPVVFVDEEVDLTQYFAITKFIGKEDTDQTDFEFYVDTQTYPGTLKSDNKTFTPSMIGDYVAYLSYSNNPGQYLYKEVKFTSIARFNVNCESTYYMDIGDTADFVLSTVGDFYQTYRIFVDDEEIFDVESDNENIHIFAKQSGTSFLNIVPIIHINGEDIEIPNGAKEITLVSRDIYTTQLYVNFYNEKGVKYEPDENNTIILYVNQKAECKTILDEETTRSNVKITSDSDIVSIKNGVIEPKKIGTASVKVKETHSGIEKQFVFKVRNLVKVNESSAFIISGIFTYNAETNTLTITNGDSVSIRYNFDNSSTYTRTVYTIMNTKIALVGNDGTITPQRAGKTVLSMEVYDAVSSHLSSEINIVILKRNFVQNVEEFMLRIRKLVGHFGAFLVMGIFSTVTYFMFLRKKWFPLGVAINFSTGYGYAAFTEWIQTLTPGRSGLMADVLIDYYGFLLSATTITVSLLIVGLVIFIINKKKKETNIENVTIDNIPIKEGTPNQKEEKKDIVDEIIEPEDKKEKKEGK